MPSGVLVLDFDGTVCLGDAPVYEYAAAVVRRLPEAERPAGEERLHSALAGFFTGVRNPDLAEAPDGYYAVAALAAELGVSDADRNAAYLESRTAVHAGEVPIFAPPGLRDVLDEARRHARVVLVTNAPERGVESLLGILGLGEVFDTVRGDAGKPAGMGPILDALLEDAALRATPDRLLSVGDIWANDLAPAAERGCSTALIDRYGLGDGEPTHVAAAIVELYPAILNWARRGGAAD
ncbi:HAD family hydrolase [Lysobacter korlensis]|uniref:HAD family hydrolase n=1 Tax=Lysobacter korlensis TaxID=553636 RepID=A0ABV6RM08_9GAMM